MTLILLPGENVNYSVDCSLVRKDCDITDGTLSITNYRLYFNCCKNQAVTCDIPLGVISRIEACKARSINGVESKKQINLHCKDIRVLKFLISDGAKSEENLNYLMNLCQLPQRDSPSLFAFCYDEHYENNGWQVYNPTEEFKRMGIPNSRWKLSKLNHNFAICDTYPQLLCVPAEASDDDIRHVADFRSRNRLPVLSWLNSKNQATICRSSQPLVGTERKRCHDDERYVEMIMKCSNNPEEIYLLDARNIDRAELNKNKGGGFETQEAYPFMKFSFLHIENIHHMRESLENVKKFCCPESGFVDEENWLANIQLSKWLLHISKIISGAKIIVQSVKNKGVSVLVHCSDGWDRTSQLVCLAMIAMDPYFRTIKGFQVLIEKEWLSIGHKFANRIGHGEDEDTDLQRSPIFLQFIDCVFQTMKHYPHAFEFNEHFLITILDHLYSCLFGTFLYNSDRLRTNADVKSKTVSLWSFINLDIECYKNKLFSKTGDHHVLIPISSICKLQLWTNYYLRHQSELT